MPNTLKNMQDLRLSTTRLDLVASTAELAQAEIDDLSAFAGLLNVPRPTSWPPPLNDEHSQRSFLASLQKAESSVAGWNLWFCIRRDQRELVGNAGFKSRPKAGNCGDWIQHAGSASAEWVLHGGRASSYWLGISMPRCADRHCPHFTWTGALNSCDGKMRIRACRGRTNRRWNADDSLRVATGTISSTFPAASRVRR
jgi:hypothetical protein